MILIDLPFSSSVSGKKFGVTDFINPKSCEDKSVSQVISSIQNLLINFDALHFIGVLSISPTFMAC